MCFATTRLPPTHEIKLTHACTTHHTISSRCRKSLILMCITQRLETSSTCLANLAITKHAAVVPSHAILHHWQSCYCEKLLL
jgi:hypothetical protein